MFLTLGRSLWRTLLVLSNSLSPQSTATGNFRNVPMLVWNWWGVTTRSEGKVTVRNYNGNRKEAVFASWHRKLQNLWHEGIRKSLDEVGFCANKCLRKLKMVKRRRVVDDLDFPDWNRSIGMHSIIAEYLVHWLRSNHVHCCTQLITARNSKESWWNFFLQVLALIILQTTHSFPQICN